MWPAIDGREGDCGFDAAFRLCREYGENIPTDEEFDEMDDPNIWPSEYAWSVIEAMSCAHANRWHKSQKEA